MKKYLIYPLYNHPRTLLERLMIQLHGGFIKCFVCGLITTIKIKGDNLRETGICKECRSTNRQRQIAYLICKTITKEKGIKITSLRDLSKLKKFYTYNTEANGATHNVLLGLNNYFCSEYLGSKFKRGIKIKGILHQDLMNLSFSDNKFDLIISSDVFEHIPDPYKAHKEVYRVLKLGGRHIFTVPFYQTEYIDEIRASVDSRGKLTFLKPPIYHGDPVRPKGTLVFTIFSLEMLCKLRHIGFRTNMYKLFNPFYGILGDNAIIFEAIKMY